MADGNLLTARAQGRNRFYRLASPDVAHAIESLMALAGTRARRPPRPQHGGAIPISASAAPATTISRARSAWP